jgi:ribose transport system substrate-binding protein
MATSRRLNKGRLALVTSTAALMILSVATIGVTASGASKNKTKTGLAFAQAQVAKYSNRAGISSVPTVKHPANLNGKVIWYIPITNAVDSLAGMGTTMTAALAKLGATVQVCDGGGLPTTVATCLTNASQQGAAAVVTSYIDYEMAPTGFQALATAGIPVIVGNEPPDPGVTPTKNLQFTYGTAETDLFSSLMAYETIVRSKGKADVLVIRLTDSPSTTAASNLEISDLKKYCPACKVTTVDAQTAALAQLPSAVSAALTSNPNINYVTVPTDAYLPPVTGAIASSGFTAKVKVISADGGVAGLQDVVSGSLLADPGNPIEWVGYQYADAVLRILSGDPVPKEPIGPTFIFTKKSLTGLSLTEANYLTMGWYHIGESAFEAPYLKAWGVK